MILDIEITIGIDLGNDILLDITLCVVHGSVKLHSWQSSGRRVWFGFSLVHFMLKAKSGLRNEVVLHCRVDLT